MRKLGRLLGALAVVLVPSVSANADTPVRIAATMPAPFYVDGWLTEWRGTQLNSVGNDAFFYALASSRDGLVFVASVRDERVVRTAAGGQGDDALLLTIASPGNSGLVATEVVIHPGVEGERAALVLAGAPGETPRPVSGARAVECPVRGGYEIEVLIPWAAVPGAADLMRARARVRLSDVDGGAPVVRASSEQTDPARLPHVIGDGGELGTLARFLRERRLERSAVTVDLRGDVTHDGRSERVVIAGGFVAVFGDGYLDGRGFDFISLGTLSARGVTEAKLLDFEGDGRLELFVTFETEERGARRTVTRVLDFDSARITTLVELETGYADARGEVTAVVSLEPARGTDPLGIRVRPGAARGLDARTLPSPSAPIIAMPTPWSGVTSRLYRFGEGRFRMVAEDRTTSAPQVAETRPAQTPTRTPAQTNTQAPPPRTPSQTRPPATPAWSAEPLIAAYRNERRLGSLAPTATHRANIAEDAREEHIVQLGHSLLVVGPGFLGGQRYFAIDLDVTEPSHVLDVALYDITNDAQAEIIVRLKKPMSPTQAFEMLVVYRMTQQGYERLLVAQVGFTDGARAIRNEARATGSGRGRRLVLAPGRAVSWDASTWRFSDTGATGGVSPLLLPWRDTEIRFRFDGRTLVRD